MQTTGHKTSHSIVKKQLKAGPMDQIQAPRSQRSRLRPTREVRRRRLHLAYSQRSVRPFYQN